MVVPIICGKDRQDNAPHYSLSHQIFPAWAIVKSLGTTTKSRLNQRPVTRIMGHIDGNRATARWAWWLFCGHFRMTAVRNQIIFDRRSKINDCFRHFTNRYCSQFLVILPPWRVEIANKAPYRSYIISDADSEVGWVRKSYHSYTSKPEPNPSFTTNCGSLSYQMSPVRHGEVVGCKFNCVVFSETRFNH